MLFFQFFGNFFMKNLVYEKLNPYICRCVMEYPSLGPVNIFITGSDTRFLSGNTDSDHWNGHIQSAGSWTDIRFACRRCPCCCRPLPDASTGPGASTGSVAGWSIFIRNWSGDGRCAFCPDGLNRQDSAR